jgi:hypothetical protein
MQGGYTGSQACCTVEGVVVIKADMGNTFLPEELHHAIG